MIPAPAVLEVGSDKIWALLVLSELLGLRAVFAQCSQRLNRLCNADRIIVDVSSETRSIFTYICVCVCMYVCMYVFYLYITVRLKVYVLVYVHVYVLVYVCMYVLYI